MTKKQDSVENPKVIVIIILVLIIIGGILNIKNLNLFPLFPLITWIIIPVAIIRGAYKNKEWAYNVAIIDGIYNLLTFIFVDPFSVIILFGALIGFAIYAKKVYNKRLDKEGTKFITIGVLCIVSLMMLQEVLLYLVFRGHW